MSPQLQQILSEIDQLSPTEQIEVLSHTIERMRQNPLSVPSTSWEDAIEDPDLGLEVKPEFIEQVLAARQSTRPTLTTEEVKQRLGLT
jgi:hypothetical protein